MGASLKPKRYSRSPSPIRGDGAADPNRRLRQAYRGLLRRSADLGWRGALDEFAFNEEASGRPREDILNDIEVFEQVNFAERLRGIDPVLAERRRNLYQIIANPVALLAGMIATGLAADHGFEAVASVTAGVGAASVVRQLAGLLAVAVTRY